MCQLMCLYETWNCHSWPQMSDLGVDLPLDLLMCTLTSILHVKLGKYELSELKSFIIILGVLRGHYIWHDSTLLSDCLLLKLFSNKRKFPPFHEESKMASKYIPYYICHNAFVGGWIDLPVDVLIWNLLKLSFLATRCQYAGGTSASRSRVDLPNFATRC